MSLGYMASCKLELEDEHTAVYSYHAENWNLPHDLREHLEAIEGMFTISKSSLEEPEVHIKRDGSVKRIMHTPSIGEHIEDGDIVVDKLSGMDQREREQGKKFPRCLTHILNKVYECYMEEGSLPETAAFIQ